MNVLVYAHRRDAVDHAKYRAWLEETVGSGGAYGLSELVLSSFVRVVTHAQVFPVPTPLADALAAAENLRAQPNCVLVAPGPGHWEIFAGLCRTANAKGNLVADAYLAALAIESGGEMDHDRPGLQPLPRSALAPPAQLSEEAAHPGGLGR